MSRILLVEPDFPIAPKSRNHKNFLPTGLLKIAAYLRDNGQEVRLVRGLAKDLGELGETESFRADEVWVTSLFTYWAEHVRDAVQYYKGMFPEARLKVGGIYASLLPAEEVKAYTGCDEVHQGVIAEVDEHARTHRAAYDLVAGANGHALDFQILHASRGCPRRCPFCGTWKVEPRFEPEKSIKDAIWMPAVVFYDNNFLMNPHIEDILGELIALGASGKLKWVESQSGLDGRILLKKPHLGRMIKDAGFRSPRIAWDWGYDEGSEIEKQIEILEAAGYQSRDIFVFMLYNHDIPFEEMEQKRISCWRWKVQIADCRYRPLTQLSDGYNPQVAGQTSGDYFISEGWSDALVKQFRRNVRRQNICVRMKYELYSSAAEHKRIDKTVLRETRGLPVAERVALLEASGVDCWVPERVSYPRGGTCGSQVAPPRRRPTGDSQ